ncbi:MAG TPA: response regulator [Phycisphaerae bacterium]|nr:response regulator [Phycisphaerae bacterium]HRR85077.1 response regulator [Phycisphaerae bacterium]
MGHADVTVGKVLLFQPEGSVVAGLSELFDRFGQVRVESTIQGALRALDEEQFGLFVSTSPEFLAADRLAAHRQLGAVLDVIGQGVCIINLSGEVTWCNARAEKLPEEVLERIRKHCVTAYGSPEGRAIVGRSRSLSLVVDNDRYYDASITPIEDRERQVTRLVVAVSDVTRARRLQQKMDAIDNAGRELVRLDAQELAKMDADQRLALLERKIIRSTRELLEFNNFAIRLLDERTNKLELVLSAGLLPEGEEIDIYASTENNGISGYVAATGRSYICPDVQKDPRYIVGISNAKSSLTVPLWLHDKVVGVFNIESDTAGAFSEEDRQFAEIFGRYVAIALHILDLLVVERHATTGRLADNVSSEIAGPLSDILSDATTLMEDYIGHDDLRHRLQCIVDNVDRIRTLVRQVVRPTSGILGAKPTQPAKDPILSGKSVLLVDDEEIIRQTVCDVLSKYGCEVEVARDGVRALAMIHARSYDLVITDIRMPGKSGYEIFAAVKEAHPGCPVIFMTGFGYDPNHSIIRASKEGLSAVLYKPFKVDQLLTDVRAAISPGKR